MQQRTNRVQICVIALVGILLAAGLPAALAGKDGNEGKPSKDGNEPGGSGDAGSNGGQSGNGGSNGGGADRGDDDSDEDSDDDSDDGSDDDSDDGSDDESDDSDGESEDDTGNDDTEDDANDDADDDSDQGSDDSDGESEDDTGNDDTEDDADDDADDDSDEGSNDSDGESEDDTGNDDPVDDSDDDANDDSDEGSDDSDGDSEDNTEEGSNDDSDDDGDDNAGDDGGDDSNDDSEDDTEGNPGGGELGGSPSARTALIIVQPDVVVLFPGGEARFSATAYDAEGDPIPDATIDWRTADCRGGSSIDEGVFTGGSRSGTCQIEAFDRGIVGIAIVRVETPRLTRIAIDADTTSPVAGSTLQIVVVGFDQLDGDIAMPLPAPVWTSTCGEIDATGFLQVRDEAGTCTVTATRMELSDSIDITIVPGSPSDASISLEDPAVAGESLTFTISVTDATGNHLGSSSFTRTFETSGEQRVCALHLGVEACMLIDVTPAAARRAHVAGPATLPAGTPGAFTISAYDAFDNLVDTNTFAFSRGKAGDASVCSTLEGLEACQQTTITPGPVVVSTLTGPSSIVAGVATDFTVSGYDAFDNLVGSAPNQISRTTAGTSDACATYENVEACKAITVTPGPLASSTITGPTRLVALEVGTFRARTYDAFDNIRMEATFPFSSDDARTHSVCRQIESDEPCMDVLVRPGDPAKLAMNGPVALVAGTPGTWTLTLLDASDNVIETSTLSRGSDTAGSMRICGELGSLTHCLDVPVLAGTPASAGATGPATLVAGSSGTFLVIARDARDNEVGRAEPSFTTQTAGAQEACFTLAGLTACALVTILPASTHTAIATGPNTLVAGANGAFRIEGQDRFDNPTGGADFTYSSQRAGDATACSTFDGIRACASLTILTGPHARSTITGPATTAAGSPTRFTLTHFDAYDNEIGSSTRDRTFETAGEDNVCAMHLGVEACMLIDVTPAAARRAHVAGPATLPAGTPGAFTISAYDAFDNLVDTNTFAFSRGKAGDASVCSTLEGLEACQQTTITPGPVVVSTLTGPSSIVAGVATDFTVSGYDAFDNLVGSAPNQISRTTAGTSDACATYENVEACKAITVTPGPVVVSTLSGPSSIVAGVATDFTVKGWDAFDNLVGSARNQISRTTAGASNVCSSYQNVEACKAITVTPGPVVVSTLSGPSSIVAGVATDFTVKGWDAFDNLVGSAPWQASRTSAGASNVCANYQNVEKCMAITVTAGPVFLSTLTGPSSIVAGVASDFTVSGYDAFDNLVGSAPKQISRTTAGGSNVCASYQNVEACKAITVTPGPVFLSTLTGPTSVIAGVATDFTVSGYDAFDNLVGSAPKQISRTTAGGSNVCASYQNVESCKAITVTPGPLASSEITGPTSLVALELGTFHARTYDAFHNQRAEIAFSFSSASARPHAICRAIESAAPCMNVIVHAGAPAELAMQGPLALVAGAPGMWTLTLLDASGNTIETNSLSRTSDTAGSLRVCGELGGITRCLDIPVLAGTPASASATGPATLVAGSSGTFLVIARDAHDNEVGRAEPTFSTQVAGDRTACFSLAGVTACAPVTILPAGTHTAIATGPNTLVAGANGAFRIEGQDRFNNPSGGADFTYSSQRAGDANACTTLDGIQACANVLILTGTRARSTLTGPATTIAGAPTRFTLSHFDAFDNELPSSTFERTFTTGGIQQVCDADRLACTSSEVLPAAPAGATVTDGPERLTAGVEGTFTLHSVDAYGNTVSTRSFAYRQTLAGGAEACGAIDGINACRYVEIVPGALATISVTPASVKLIHARSIVFHAGYADAYGNTIPASGFSLTVGNADIARPIGPEALRIKGQSLGHTTLSISSGGVTGNAAIHVVTPEEGIAALRIVPPAVPGGSVPELAAGEPFVFTIGAVDDFGVPIEGLSPVFTVADPTRGSIDEHGVFTGDQAGETDLTATVGDVSTTITVRVVPGVPRQIEIRPASATRTHDSINYVDFKAYAMDARRNTVENVVIGWALASDSTSLGSIDTTRGTDVRYTIGPAREPGRARLIATALDIPIQVSREAIVYQYINDVIAPADRRTHVEPFVLVAQIDEVTSTTHVAGFAAVGAGAILDFDVARAGQPMELRDATVTIQSAASDVTVMIEVMPSNDVVLPAEIDRELFEQRRASGADPQTALFITISATENGERVDSERLNTLLDKVEVEFTVDAAYFARNRLDPTQVHLVEWEDGILVNDNVLARLVTPNPVGGLYTYRATLTQFSTFAFVARPLPSSPPAGSDVGSPRQSSPLTTILISGPDRVVAGTVATYILTGVAQDGTVRRLAQNEITFRPTLAGVGTVRYEERGIVGEREVEIVPGDPTTLVGRPSGDLVAGASGGIRLLGQDSFGNLIDLGVVSIDLTAAGRQTVTVSHGGLTAQVRLRVASGQLAAIAIDGPLEIVAGSAAVYSLQGFDSAGNVVELTQGSLMVDSPTTAGPVELFYTEDGIEATLRVQVLPGPLASIEVKGSAIIAIDTTETFELIGFDAFGNRVALDRDTLEFVAPADAHDTYVCYAQDGVSGCQTVKIEVPVTLHKVVAENVAAPQSGSIAFVLSMLGLVGISAGSACLIVLARRRRRDDEQR